MIKKVKESFECHQKQRSRSETGEELFVPVAIYFSGLSVLDILNSILKYFKSSRQLFILLSASFSHEIPPYICANSIFSSLFPNISPLISICSTFHKLTRESAQVKEVLTRTFFLLPFQQKWGFLKKCCPRQMARLTIAFKQFRFLPLFVFGICLFRFVDSPALGI